MELSNDSGRLRLELIENEGKYIQMQTGNRDLVDKYFYIIFHHEDKKELERLKHNAMYLFKSMSSARDVDFYEHLLTTYRYLNPSRGFYERKDIYHLKDLEVCDYINLIGIEADKNKFSQYIYIDGVYCKTFHAYSYPDSPFLAWLSYLTEFRDIDFSLYVEDCDSARLMKTYDKQYNSLCKGYDKATECPEQERLENDMESVELTIGSLSRGTKKVVSFVATFHLEASSLEGLVELESLLVQETSNLDILIRQGFFDQRELLYSSAPLCCNRIKEYTKDAICNIISWGFPFVYESPSDDNLPIPIRRSRSMGGAILYNHPAESKSRTNSDEAVFGYIGPGRTYFLMYLALHRHSRGMK